MDMDSELQRCSELKWEAVKIMAQASVSLPGDPTIVEIRRGMRITSNEGREAGYQSLPVSWIARVAGEKIVLNASFERILTIPGWHVMDA